jgi:hypothetical protein
MIKCRNCKFEVKASMRHSLVKNCCPACGGALLGELHSRRLSLFRQRLVNQPFSEKLESDDIFDIALFMLVEFFPPDIEPPVPNDEEAAPEGSEAAEEASEAVADVPTEEESYEAIRDQVRVEALSNEALSPDLLDAELKVQRLKRIAKESKIRSPGTFVRRLSSD